MEVRMEHFEKPTGRRKFLKKGIKGGVMIAAFPLWKSISPNAPRPDRYFQRHSVLSDGSQRKLLKILRKYGGEFGNTRGGL
jgi:hypothetical protein